MTFTFQLSEDEFCRAHRFHLRRVLLNGKNIGLMTMALILAALQAQVLGPAAWVGPLFLVLWVMIVVGMVYAYYRLPVSLYRRKPELRSEQILSFDRDEVEWRGGDVREVEEWSALTRTHENAEFFLFYFRAALPVVLPKRAIADGEAFRRFVGERIDAAR